MPLLELIYGVEIVRLPLPRRNLDRSNPFEMTALAVGSLLWGLGPVLRFKPDATVAFFGLPGGPLACVLRTIGKMPYLISLRGGDVPGFQKNDLAVYH